MKQATHTALMLSILMLSGCSMSDLVYAVFSEGYTGGGPTEIDKRRHYDQQVDRSQSYDRQLDMVRHYSP